MGLVNQPLIQCVEMGDLRLSVCPLIYMDAHLASSQWMGRLLPTDWEIKKTDAGLLTGVCFTNAY